MEKLTEEITLATEIMHELKRSTKRWFIAFLVMIGVEACTIGGFLWYISLPVDEIAIENQDGNANYVGHDVEGDVNNGEDYSETQSGKK